MHFNYKNNELFVEDLAISKIAEQVGTPFYCYSKATLIENFQVFDKAFKGTENKICYAIKANPNINLVRILAELGAGIDAVSAGEIYRAEKSGIAQKKIVFAGVGKTAQEMEYALKNGKECR